MRSRFSGGLPCDYLPLFFPAVACENPARAKTLGFHFSPISPDLISASVSHFSFLRSSRLVLFFLLFLLLFRLSPLVFGEGFGVAELQVTGIGGFGVGWVFSGRFGVARRRFGVGFRDGISRFQDGSSRFDRWPWRRSRRRRYGRTRCGNWELRLLGYRRWRRGHGRRGRLQFLIFLVRFRLRGLLVVGS